MKNFGKLILKLHAISVFFAISVGAPESHANSVSLAWEKKNLVGPGD